MTLPSTVRIIRAAAQLAGLQEADITGERRDRAAVRPRQRAMYLARCLRPEASLAALGAKFGGRDHTTVLHTMARVRTRLAEDVEERAALVVLAAWVGLDELPPDTGQGRLRKGTSHAA